MEASALARRAPLGTLKPGHVSPMRAVPEHIERPEYMFHDGPERVTASDIKSPETIANRRRKLTRPTKTAPPSHRASPRRNSTASATNS